MTTDISEYLDGHKLYGDDFSDKDIASWFEAERTGYTDLPWEDPDDSSPEAYWYGELNRLHGFKFLPTEMFPHALGLGSARGGEFMPIIDQIQKITIVEPSETLRSDRLGSIAPTYTRPHADGSLDFDDETFDLALLFGVLHHIPNVTAVVNELGRCLRGGGWMVLREPMISMGDWRQARPGLTAHERGIPRSILIDIVESAGFSIVHSAPCMSPVIARLAGRWPLFGPDHRFGAQFDSFFCRVLEPNYRYHATKLRHKLRPTSIMIVAQRSS